jgi:hypothetical protein
MANVDWPGNNIKIYRSDKTGYRWRFCLIDLELALNPNGWTDCYFDHIQFMRSCDPGNPYINIWLKGIQNERFKNYFINRYADLMNTAYRFDRISEMEHEMFEQTVVEMQKEFARWGDPNRIPEQMAGFTENHEVFQFQLSERTAQVRNHIMANFDLPNLVDLTLNVIPEEAGKIRVSTIEPDYYPWQGVYFNGVPVKIEAIANEGYNFLYWGNNGLIADTLNAIFLDMLNISSVSFDAYFEDLATSIPEVRENNSFFLYPNPANKILYLRSNKPMVADLNYQVIDVNGRILTEGFLNGGMLEYQIPVQSIPSGVYLIRLTNSSKEIEQIRFVKI